MKKQPRVALLCAGNLTDSAITRFRGLGAMLGPVKSSSLRLASRFANILRAGQPVGDYEAFKECPLLLIAVPDAFAAEAIRDVYSAGLEWSRQYVVLCSATLESDQLSSFAELGARTASVCEACGFDGRLFLGEGDRKAIKQVRPLIESRTSRLLALPRGHKKFYLAASACSGPLYISVLSCAAECLKLAGIGPVDAAAILQAQTEKTTRSFLKGGRKACLTPADLEREIAALNSHSPDLGEFFEQSAKLAVWLSTKM